MVSEKIQLLGKGLYKTIPDEITIQAIPTASELDYVSAEDFEATMLDKIFPKAIEEKDCNWRELLEIDFHWICRCLRITNYGPYHNVNTIFCEKCGAAHRGDYIIDLRAVPCIPLPAQVYHAGSQPQRHQGLKDTTEHFRRISKHIFIKL